jgi:hypothetical protein
MVEMMRRVYQTKESRLANEKKVRNSIISFRSLFRHYTQKVSFMKIILGKFNQNQLFGIFNSIFYFDQRVGICLFWIYSSR